MLVKTPIFSGEDSCLQGGRNFCERCPGQESALHVGTEFVNHSAGMIEETFI
jgi:hypothetical protein